MNKNDKSFQKALEKIKKAKAAQATELDLAGLDLKNLPPEIGQLTSLQSLELVENKLSALPPEIGQLTSLQLLSLGGNQLSTIAARDRSAHKSAIVEFG